MEFWSLPFFLVELGFGINMCIHFQSVCWFRLSPSELRWYTPIQKCGFKSFALSFGAGLRYRYVHAFLKLLLLLPFSFGAEVIYVFTKQVLKAFALSFEAGLRYPYVQTFLKCLLISPLSFGAEVVYVYTKMWFWNFSLFLLELGFGVDMCIHFSSCCWLRSFPSTLRWYTSIQKWNF